MVIDSLNHEGTGDFTNSKLDLNTKTTANVSLDMDKVNYMKNIKLIVLLIIKIINTSLQIPENIKKLTTTISII